MESISKQNKILKLRHCSKSFNGIDALVDFNCDIYNNEIIGLIGPNGAGKSTLFNIITGFINQDNGLLFFNNQNITNLSPHIINKMGISRTFQKLRLIKQMTVINNVMLSFKKQPGENLRTILFNNKKSKVTESKNRTEANELLKIANLEAKADDLASDLSYGQQKLLNIICCLATDADLFLLDEPIAGINPSMIENVLLLIQDIHKTDKTIVIIEHNMDVITETCNRVIFMDAGKKVSEGTPEQVKNDPRVISAYLN